MVFIGIAQMRAISDYNKIKDEYGPSAYCYLCGLQNYKKCECQYISNLDDSVLDDLSGFALSLADYNVRTCAGMEIQDGSYDVGSIYGQVDIIVPNMSK
jgi:hypothetical protein